MTTTSPPTRAELLPQERLDRHILTLEATPERARSIWQNEQLQFYRELQTHRHIEREFHNIDDVAKIRELESHIARLAVERDELMREEKKSHSQIDGLMKRLLRTEATLRILSDTSHFKDMDAMAEFARIAMASQGGGDG